LEIKVVINKSNKEKILALLEQLVEAEGITGEEHPSQKGLQVLANPSVAKTSFHDQLDACYAREEVPVSAPSIARRPFGAWAMFNSFFPGKATLRVLAHTLAERKAERISFGELIERSSQSFRPRGLAAFRGFPRSKKASSIPRFASHLVLPLGEMGILSIQTNEGAQEVGITESGLQFSLLENDVLDRRLNTEQLSESERPWLIEHLKSIDRQGFKEYSTLSSILHYIGINNPGRPQLVQWLATRPDFRENVKSTSKYAGEQSKFTRQLHNIANTYMSSKVALLRELDILDNTRGVYKVKSEM
jgi:hypothetical protein